MNEATIFEVTKSGIYNKKYTIKVKDKSLYLGRNSSDLVAKKSSDEWNVGRGNDFYYDDKYIYYNNSGSYQGAGGDWDNCAKLFAVTEETTQAKDQTKLTFTGHKVGTSTVTIAGVEYTINAVAVDLSGVTLPVNLWITNTGVVPTGWSNGTPSEFTYSDTDGNRRSIYTLKANYGAVYSEDGIALNSILPATSGTAKSGDGNEYDVVYDVEVVPELKTATEMYYEISKDGKGNFIVTNTGTGILSLTNLTVTYSTESSVSLAPMSAEEQTSAVMMVRAMFAPPAPTVFEPETFTVSLKNYKDVYVREYIKVTVTTSDDVKYITVGDKRISGYDDERVWGGFRKGFVKTGKRIWSYYVSFNTAGQQVISVVAYDADGLASEAVENTVNIKPRSAWRGKKSEWHI